MITNGVLDIVELWKSTVERLNQQNSCSCCWEFYAPLTEVKLNIVRNKGNCCTHVFLLRNKPNDFTSALTYNNGYLNTEVNTENYDVLFLISSKTGLNNYNELAHHPIEESRYATIFKPLRECIKSDIITALCEHAQVTSWSGRYVYDYQDENYYGLRISISQRYERH
ncbi:MAG TPA: hypothetical protein VK031_02065 [Tissierellaceae bacterium]|nr:hypothetical protein [Tissierellaceae bacterium]